MQESCISAFYFVILEENLIRTLGNAFMIMIGLDRQKEPAETILLWLLKIDS